MKQSSPETGAAGADAAAGMPSSLHPSGSTRAPLSTTNTANVSHPSSGRTPPPLGALAPPTSSGGVGVGGGSSDGGWSAAREWLHHDGGSSARLAENPSLMTAAESAAYPKWMPQESAIAYDSRGAASGLLALPLPPPAHHHHPQYHHLQQGAPPNSPSPVSTPASTPTFALRPPQAQPQGMATADAASVAGGLGSPPVVKPIDLDGDGGAGAAAGAAAAPSSSPNGHGNDGEDADAVGDGESDEGGGCRGDAAHRIGDREAQAVAAEALDLEADLVTFEELLDAEVAVNPMKLRESSRRGIPPQYRATVYRYLLGITFVDKSSEMTLERMQETDFAELLAAHRALFSAQPWRHHHHHHHGDTGGGVGVAAGGVSGGVAGGSVVAGSRAVGGGGGGEPGPADTRIFRESNAAPISRRESAYTHNYSCRERNTRHGVVAWTKLLDTTIRRSKRFEGHPEGRKRLEIAMQALQVVHPGAAADEIDHMYTLAQAFEGVFTTSARDIFLGVEALLHLLTHYDNILQDVQCMQKHCGTFLMLFHSTNATLYDYFFKKGLTAMEWVPSMLTMLLAGHLHPEDLWQLWDTYLADALEVLGFPIHPYVCLALLNELTEELVEMDRCGIAWRLTHLPRVNVRGLLRKAVSLRESVNSQGLLIEGHHASW